ncbi:MAG: long-chain-fatty-acid--CoA ligase, partial [Dermatophilaceae bacterium]
MLAWPLEFAARTYGDRTAVIDGDRVWTYHELRGRVRRLGAALDGLSLSPGAPIGALLANTAELLELWLAVPAYGRVLVPLNTRLAVPELAFIAGDARISTLVVDAAHLQTGRRLREQCQALSVLVFAGPGRCPPDCIPFEALHPTDGIAPPDLPSDTTAAVMYTGGTTGHPKGVALSHGNVLANSKHVWITNRLLPDDRWLHASPLFHAAGSQMIHPLTWVGATHVLTSHFDPGEFVRLVAEHRVTATLMVPTMIRMIVDHLAADPGVDMSSLRLLHYGAAPMPVDLLRSAATVLDCEFVQGYGMTEAGPAVTTLSPQAHRAALAGEHLNRLGSVGCAMPGVQLEVRDALGQPVAEGTVGEVWVRGPNVMKGYLDRPAETEQVLVDGWYRTGDAGRLDGAGYLYLVDRLRDMIISGGENVYSIEVERAVGTHPQVAEVAVVGVPDERWGERVHAVVVVTPRSCITAGDVVDHCRPLIAGYKLPTSVEIGADPLPKSGVGKVLKREIRQKAAQSRTTNGQALLSRAPV